MKTTIAPDFRDLFRGLTEEELEHAKNSNSADPKHERIPPVVVWKCGKDWLIVDGHHTHTIRQSLRVDGKPARIRYHKIDFPDRQSAIAYAIRAQLGRRNLSPSQVAIALAKLPKAEPARPPGSQLATTPKPGENAQKDRETLAKEAGIGRRTLQRADKVEQSCAKAVKDAIAAGDVSVADAASIVDLPKKEQVAALGAVKRGEAKTLKAAANDEPDPKAQAKKNKQLAHSHRDKLARAICDYHEVSPNRSERDRLVKLVQGVELW